MHESLGGDEAATCKSYRELGQAPGFEEREPQNLTQYVGVVASPVWQGYHDGELINKMTLNQEALTRKVVQRYKDELGIVGPLRKVNVIVGMELDIFLSPGMTEELTTAK